MIAPMRNMFVLALLCDDDTILLQHRYNTSFGNGLYGLPGGKVEEDERALQAIQRELSEELGLTIPESACTLVHTLHRKGTETEFIALCFKVDITGLTIHNKEPDKYDKLTFFTLSHLPSNIIPAHQQIISLVLSGVSYSEHGW